METLKSHLGLLETTDFGFQRLFLGNTSSNDKNVLWSVIDIGKIALKKCFEYVSNKNAYILFEMCCYSLVCRCLISTIICFRKQNIKIHLHKLVRLFCLHIPSIAVIEMFVLSLSLRGHHSSFFPKAVLWSFIRRWFVKEMLHV